MPPRDPIQLVLFGLMTSGMPERDSRRLVARHKDCIFDFFEWYPPREAITFSLEHVLKGEGEFNNAGCAK